MKNKISSSDGMLHKKSGLKSLPYLRKSLGIAGLVIILVLGTGFVYSAFADNDYLTNPNSIVDLRHLEPFDFAHVSLNREFGVAVDYNCAGCRENIVTARANGMEYSDIFRSFEIHIDESACMGVNFPKLREQIPEWRCDGFIRYILPAIYSLVFSDCTCC